MSLNLMVIVASTRPGRLGPAVADWFVDTVRAQAEQQRITIDIADLAEVGLPLLDEPEHASAGRYVHEHTRAWSRRVAAADAFVVVTPEYNYGMPASLKNAIDYLYAEWAWKPVGFVSYGNTAAGTRAVQMAKQVVTTVRMVPVGATVALRLSDHLDDGSVRIDPARKAAARDVLAEVARVADALRVLRIEGEETPVAGARVAPLRSEDVGELLVLQRCCWVQEAVVDATLDIPPLHETVEEVAAWVAQWQVWGVRLHGRLIAAVRARTSGPIWEIGRLMVAPDHAGQGLGRWLLAYVEGKAPAEVDTFALFTGAHSDRNIALYQRAGYELTGSPADGVVHLVKQRLSPVAVDA